MTINNLMCDDLEKARLNRERVKEGYGNVFYAQQQHAIAQWHAGEEPPESIVFGELPYVGKDKPNKGLGVTIKRSQSGQGVWSISTKL